MAALSATVAVLQPHSAEAGAYYYSGMPRTFNVGMLVTDSESLGVSVTDVDPYVFYVLNNRPDVLPGGWVITNPAAPKVITPEIYSNFEQSPIAAYQTAYTVNQPVTPNMAPYWEVLLKDASASSLAQYDLLIMHSHGYMDFSQSERRALRQFVDQGGTLWIEDSEGASTGPGLFTNIGFSETQSNSGATASNLGVAVLPNGNSRHPLLTTPYFLSQDEIDDLGDKHVGKYFITSRLDGTKPPDDTLDEVVGNSAYPVSTGGYFPYICAGDYGAGHLVVTIADVCDTINDYVGPAGSNRGPYSGSNFAAAHTQDLKFLVNILNWTGSNASTDGVDDRHSGFQKSPIEGALVPVWTYGTALGTTFSSPGSAVVANIAYVSDNYGGPGSSTSYLHAFDIYPQEDLNGDGNPDDGAAGNDPLTGVSFTNDYDSGATYDELWNTQVANGPISAPCIAYVPTPGTVTSTAVALVEDSKGDVITYLAAVNGGQAFGGTVKGDGGGAYTSGVPAPVFYRGRILAGQPDGKLMVIDASTLTSATPTSFYVNLDPNDPPVDTSPVTSTPAVASIPSNDGTWNGSDIMAYVSTQNAVYAVFLGSRDDEIQPSPGGGGNTYQTKPSIEIPRLSSGGFYLQGAPEDISTDPSLWLYDLNGGGWGTNGGSTSSFLLNFFDASGMGQGPGSITFNSAPTNTPYYADYDLVGPTGTSGMTLTRTTMGSEYQASTGIAGGTGVVGVAVDPNNVVYFTVNEESTGYKGGYIEAVQEQNPSPIGGPGSQVLWRFALVNATDADGITYNFAGYSFQGAPVVDNAGNVFAVVSNGVTSAMLCFNASAQVSIQLPAAYIDGTALVMQQTDELGQVQDPLQRTQYSIPQNAQVADISNFSKNYRQSNIGTNLVAPLPVDVTYSAGDLTGVGAVTGAPTPYPMKTSAGGTPLLNWWVQIPAGAVGPARRIGSSIYMGSNATTSGGAGLMFAVDALAPAHGATIASSNRQVLNTSTSTYLESFPDAVGSVDSPVVNDGQYAVAVGSSGIEGLGFELTMVADGNRLIELDPSGNAYWECDSTYLQNLVGGDTYDFEEDASGSNGQPLQGFYGSYATTRVSFSHPGSITQINQDDIMVADTGNNRCVRIDRTGRVLWELASFNDPNKLLPVGEPLTLSGPASVTEWITFNPTTATTYPGALIDHYLIADTGNYRIIEVDDVWANAVDYNTLAAGNNPTGLLEQHVLAWVSHSRDPYGRRYQYTGAALYYTPTGAAFIVGAVANVAVAPLATVTTGSTSYPTFGSANADRPGSSLVGFAYTASTAQETVGEPVFVANTVQPYVNGTLSGTAIPLRGLRFFNVYSLAAGSSNAQQKVTITDADGVFDGVLDFASSVTNPVVGADWSYTLANFDTMTGSTLPFVPVSAIYLPNGDYLITNGGSTGNPMNPNTTGTLTNDFGGDVFEINPTTDVLALPMMGIPDNTAPLSQPSFALRAQ
jgi:hypothetical protein